ncbi:MAG: nuclear transport factor 2 family protein [Pseudomonadota bacterium]
MMGLGRLCGMVLVVMGCAGAPLPGAPADADRAMVEAVLADLDRTTLPAREHLRNYEPGAVILAPGLAEIRGHAAIEEHLAASQQGVSVTMRHEIVELTAFGDLVVAQGRVVGVAQPDGDANAYPFETKNIIMLRRQGDGTLKIWKVIYNAAPQKLN